MLWSMIVILLAGLAAVLVAISVVVIPFMLLGTLRDIHRELQLANRKTDARDQAETAAKGSLGTART
jgi:hypothetical protein